MQDGDQNDSFVIDEHLGTARDYRERVLAQIPGLLVHTADKILYANDGLARMLGYESGAEVVALPSVYATIPPDSRQPARIAYQRCADGDWGGEVRRVRRQRADSSSQWFDQLLERAEWGGAPAILEILVVVRPYDGFTEFPHQWQRLQAAIDAMPNGVLMLDDTLAIEGLNSEFLQLWDYAPGLFPPGTRFADMLRYNHARGDYGPVDRETKIAELLTYFQVKGVVNAERHVPGDRVIDIRTAPRADGGVVVTHYDITERKRIENELRQAKEHAETVLRDLREAQKQLIVQEKMASLGQLTAGIAHELKNPLNFVNNFAELSSDLLDELRQLLQPFRERLDREVLVDLDDVLDNLQRNARKVVEHGRRADGIVRSMLAHSRGGGGERRPTEINAVVEESLALASHAARASDREFNVHFEKRYDQDIGAADMVPQDVSRVLLNLFTNAFYSVRRRQLELADPEYRPTVRIATKGGDSTVSISVRDNGGGMAPAVLEKIFTPFFTTKPTGEGTGLGLSLSYDIVVHQHRGQFEVRSVENEFAEFLITLPRAVPGTTVGERRQP